MKKPVCLSAVLCLILLSAGCAPVTIKSFPDGAHVYDADATTLLGTTPYKTSVISDEKTFLLRKNRFHDEQVTIDGNSPETVSVRMRALPVKLHSEPVADIYAAGNDSRLGTTPMMLDVYSNEKTYTLQADGYYSKDVSLREGSPDNVMVHLDRRPLVTMHVKPDGTEIFENDEVIGVTPVTVEILEPRTFELRRDGHFKQTVTINQAPPYDVKFELEAHPIITIDSDVPGAEIYHNDKKKGKVPDSFVISEETTIEVRAPRHYSRTLVLTPDSERTMMVQLKPMPYVTIESRPSGATVTANGKTIGVTPLEKLIETPLYVRVEKDGYQSVSARLTGADGTITIDLEPVTTPAP